MIVLDTNVLSAPMGHQAEQPVIDGLDRQQPWTPVWTTSITILEILFGLQTLPLGKRRSYLLDTFFPRGHFGTRQRAGFRVRRLGRNGTLMVDKMVESIP
jgi:hypothetical protein